VLLEEHFGRRAYHQSRGMRESSVGDTSHPLLLRDIRHNTHKPRYSCIFSGPCTRGDEVFVCSKFDGQVSHVHGASVPLQPEPHVLRPNSIFRKSIGPEIVPLFTNLVAAFTHLPCLPSTEI
jgi:hypothetical protein